MKVLVLHRNGFGDVGEENCIMNQAGDRQLLRDALIQYIKAEVGLVIRYDNHEVPIQEEAKMPCRTMKSGAANIIPVVAY